MRLRRWLLPFAFLVSSGIWSCTPYDRLQGEFNAGSIDPFDFAPPYRTSNGLAANGLAAFASPCVRQTEGSCTIQEFTAFVGGTSRGYFRFPFSPSQITTTQYAPTSTLPANYSTTSDPNFLNPALFTSLRVSGTGAIPTPNVYIFDPPAGSQVQCNPPAGYVYDAYRDAVHFDDQGYIFTGLPTANYGIGSNPTWSYTPVVQEVPVTSAGESCQDIKSEISALTHNDVTVPHGLPRADGSPTGQPDGTYYAWAMIDPGSQVFRLGETASNNFGYSHHKYGWFNRYLVAYLDGGQITIVPSSNPPRMATQRIYYPRQIGALWQPNTAYAVNDVVTNGVNVYRCTVAGTSAATGGPSGTGTAVVDGTPPTAATWTFVSTATLGGGNDVMQFARGQTGYSPVCQVVSYVFPGPGTMPPRDAATIQTNYSPSFQPPPSPATQGGPITPTFTFCIQVLN